MSENDENNGGSDWGGPRIVYNDALALVHNAIMATREGLLANPSREQERKLNKILARLQVEVANLESMLIALAKKQPVGVEPPTQAHVDEIAKLTGEVEGLTRETLTAASALSVASSVLALAVDITGG